MTGDAANVRVDARCCGMSPCIWRTDLDSRLLCAYPPASGSANVRADAEIAARGLRASRDRRGSRDDEIIRELAVEGLQALARLEACAARSAALETLLDEVMNEMYPETFGGDLSERIEAALDGGRGDQPGNEGGGSR